MAQTQPPRVVVYSSEVSGSIKVRRETTRIGAILDSRKIPYSLVDVSIDELSFKSYTIAGEAKAYMRSKSGNNVLPQIFVDGEFKVGGFEALDEANEDGMVAEWLFGSSGASGTSA
ncbi:hypothetical protein DFJ73DRAFT_761231 [Zopfochytrium polystomum]|nr:hypothetical protein DFJ73DRAFT_761231 [Zopfochytrium polystomum]